MNQLPGEKVRQIMTLLLGGYGVREVAKTVGVSKVTVSRYRTIIEAMANLEDERLPDCPCGGQLGHRGWCKWRYARSEKRQAYHRSRRREPGA